MLYLDLAELPELFDAIPFWSARRWALAWFKRSDYLGPQDVPLDVAVRDLVEKSTGTRPSGAVCLLTHLRYFGYCMNPVSFYYCFDVAGLLESIVAEITNTPWKERHRYVLPIAAAAGAGSANSPRQGSAKLKHFAFDKQFHVSPFMAMDMQYDWRFSEPQERLLVSMQNLKAGKVLFDATLALRAQPISRASLLRALWRYPFMTLKVIGAIHWQALKLLLKGTPIYNHPNSPTAQPRES